MNARRRCVAGVLALLIMGISVPPKNSCAESQLFVKAEENAVTRHEPQVMSTPEKEIEYGSSQKEESSIAKKYIWMGAIGLIAVAAGAVALVGSEDDSEDKNEGITIGW